MDLRGRYFPAGAEPNDQLSVIGNSGLTALFSPNDEQSHRIQDRITHPARQEKENLVLAETNKRLSNALVDDIKTTSNLASGSGKKQSKKTKPSEQDIDGRLNEMLGIIQDLRDKLEKEKQDRHDQLEKERQIRRGELEKKKQNRREELEKERQDRREELEIEREARDKDVKSLFTQLDEERANRKEDMEALRRVTLLITPLHLRVLLDLARQKVLEHFDCASWEDLCENKSVYQLAGNIYSMLSNVPNCPSAEAVTFLCAYNNVRRTGNSAAHTAKQEDVRTAVTTKELETNDRQYLEQIYAFTYGQPV